VRCPSCGADNIPGLELCESCGSDLAGLDTPEAAGGFVGRLMTDRIADLELTPPLTVSPDDSAAMAIGKMREARRGSVQVRAGERLVGVFTERDVLARIVCRGIDPGATPVGEVMTPAPTTLSTNDPPAFAIHRMVSQGFRHLPILQAGELVGSISVRDILRYIDRAILGVAG
jgi:CBS domain-containing protein